MTSLLSPPRAKPGALRRFRLPRGMLLQASTVFLVAAMGLGSVIGFTVTDRQIASLQDHRAATRDMRIFQQAMIDAETGVRGFLLTQEHEYLRPYIEGTAAIHLNMGIMLPRLDRFQQQDSTGLAKLPSAGETLAQLEKLWATAVQMTETGHRDEAMAFLRAGHDKPLMDRMRVISGAYLSSRNTAADQTGQRIALEQVFGLLLDAAGTLLAVCSVLWSYRMARRKAAEREQAIATSEDAHRHVDQLFHMTDMLQSTTVQEDANEVLRTTATSLLPDLSGLLYVFNNSRDRLDLSLQWGDGNNQAVDHITPCQCWALKRGRPHTNHEGASALRCRHVQPDGVSLEIPMSARGELYGLMVISSLAKNAAQRIAEVQPLLTALADSMSLALSSIALREKLRSQALRDGLTGLYNRRFLEEMRERMMLDAQRREVPLSVVMIDLDHFKLLNDRHGHAAGDAALRGVAGQIMSVVRATDVVCRYGGEELAILMPDCSLDMAVQKADQIRTLIAEGHGREGTQAVTASFGVASIPETSTRAGDLFVAADEALYKSKQNGRNCVTAAPLRREKPKLPMLNADAAD